MGSIAQPFKSKSESPISRQSLIKEKNLDMRIMESRGIMRTSSNRKSSTWKTSATPHEINTNSKTWEAKRSHLFGWAVQRDPKAFLGPGGFLKAWGTNANKRHIFKTILVFRPGCPRRQGHKTILFYKTCGLWILVPHAFEKPPGPTNALVSL